MEILLDHKTDDSDLNPGMQVCYKNTDGFYNKLGFITDSYEQDGIKLYLINTAMGSYSADELKLIKPLFINLLEKNKENKELIEKIKGFELLQEHPKYKVGQVITFIAGYYNNILYQSKIIGFDKEEQIYVFWDCYWSPIRDEPKRQINIIE